MTILTRFCAGLILAATCATAVHAADDTGLPTQAVRVADLNMNSSQDVAELLRRIDSAAQTVCAEPATESGIRANQARFCLKQAVQSAVQRINSPKLTALFLHEHASPAPELLARRTP
jgi:UrcA family protein